MSKVKIPENVANWINFCKAYGLRFFGSVEPIGDFGEPLADAFSGDLNEVLKWIRPNQEVYLEAWVNGYETVIPRYKVYLDENDSGSVLLLHRRTFPTKIGYEWSCMNTDSNHTFTKVELEELGLGWVLDCPDVKLVKMATKSY